MARNQYMFMGTSEEGDQRIPLVFGYQGSNVNTRPGISFPLGTGLVVLAIFLLSTIFSFCYHWLRLRKTIIRGYTQPTTTNTYQNGDQIHNIHTNQMDLTLVPHDIPHAISFKHLQLLPCPPVVYMAGEHLPRFVALPCPFLDPSLIQTKQSTLDDSNLDSLSKALHVKNHIYTNIS